MASDIQYMNAAAIPDLETYQQKFTHSFYQ